LSRNLRRLLLLVLVLTVPVLLSLETWQAFRYRKLQQEVRELEEQQREWIETNKKVLANISLFRSPDRIEKLALEELGLTELEAERLLRIEIAGEDK
jgi:hypothetical protein